MQLEPAFGLKFSKYLLELLRDNVTGFHCVGVPRHGEEKKNLQSSPSSFHRGERLLGCFINVGQATIYLPHLGGTWRDIPLQSQKNRFLRACAGWPHQSLYRPNATNVRNVRLQQMPWPSARSKQFENPQGCTAKQRRDKDSYI